MGEATSISSKMALELPSATRPSKRGGYKLWHNLLTTLYSISCSSHLHFPQILPLTVAAILLFHACHYLLAVLSILPHIYILRLAIVPVILWQAWYCAVGLDWPTGLARLLGRDSVGRYHHENYRYVVRDSFSKYVFPHALSSDWDNRCYIEIPRMGTRYGTSQRYEPPATEGQHAFLKRPLSIPERSPRRP